MDKNNVERLHVSVADNDDVIANMVNAYYNGDETMTIKHIVKKTHYWLFKKTNDESKYYYVRTMTEGLDRVVWFMGYENHFGSVSSVGGELSDETQKQLESEFQQSN
jgi:hypothetical protein